MSIEAPRIVLLTATQRRHRYLASKLSGSTDLIGIVTEEKAPPITTTEETDPADLSLMQKHLATRAEVEDRLIGTQTDFPDVQRLHVAHGGTNDPATYEWVTSLDPDAVVLFGTSIIKDPLLSHFTGRMINLHLGLSPYYRGSGTNFWPLVDGLPECVGATIHVAVEKVDAGPVLAQVRPDVTPQDGAHEFGTKTVIAAADLMPRVIELHLAGHIQPTIQDLSKGKLSRRRDFNAGAIRELHRRLEAGMVREYLDHKRERCARYPIVEPPV